jgi:hypothetical protein
LTASALIPAFRISSAAAVWPSKNSLQIAGLFRHQRSHFERSKMPATLAGSSMQRNLPIDIDMGEVFPTRTPQSEHEEEAI